MAPRELTVERLAELLRDADAHRARSWDGSDAWRFVAAWLLPHLVGEPAPLATNSAFVDSSLVVEHHHCCTLPSFHAGRCVCACGQKSKGTPAPPPEPKVSPELYEQMLKSARGGIVGDPYTAGKELVDLRLEVARLRAAPREPGLMTACAEYVRARGAQLAHRKVQRGADDPALVDATRTAYDAVVNESPIGREPGTWLRSVQESLEDALGLLQPPFDSVSDIGAARGAIKTALDRLTALALERAAPTEGT